MLTSEEVSVREWDDLDEIKHAAKLLRATYKLAKVPTSTILEAQAEKSKTSGDTAVYEDYMKNWPKPE